MLQEALLAVLEVTLVYPKRKSSSISNQRTQKKGSKRYSTKAEWRIMVVIIHLELKLEEKQKDSD